jgi:hypothetical protein
MAGWSLTSLQTRLIELAAKVGDGDRQAALLFWVSIASSPSVNVMPWMTFGN